MTWEMWAKRVAERYEWMRKIDDPNVIHWNGKVALVEATERIPAELLTGLLPLADLIVTAYPVDQSLPVGDLITKWIMKVRLDRVPADNSSRFISLDKELSFRLRISSRLQWQRIAV